MKNDKSNDKQTLKTIKAYIVYGGTRGFWNASLVLENGWSAFGHLCSDPCYMKWDLWLGRPERHEIMRDLGYEIEIVGDPISGSDNAPKWLMSKHLDKSNWREMADAYKARETTAKALGK